MHVYNTYLEWHMGRAPPHVPHICTHAHTRIQAHMHIYVHIHTFTDTLVVAPHTSFTNAITSNIVQAFKSLKPFSLQGKSREDCMHMQTAWSEICLCWGSSPDTCVYVYMYMYIYTYTQAIRTHESGLIFISEVYNCADSHVMWMSIYNHASRRFKSISTHASQR